jgi:hypothetical protein
MPRAKKKAAGNPVDNFGAAATEAVNIDLDPERASVHLPNLHANAPFVLAYHPHRWTVRDGRVFPQLRRVPIEPGVNNTTQDKDGTLRWRGMSGMLQDKGWTIIPHREGPGGQSYLRRPQVKRGYAHIEVFETPYPGRTTVEVDHAARCEWMDSLFDKEVLPPRRAEPLRALRAREFDSLQDTLTRTKDHAKFSTVARIHEANIEAIDKALEELGAGAPSPVESVTLED